MNVWNLAKKIDGFTLITKMSNLCLIAQLIIIILIINKVNSLSIACVSNICNERMILSIITTYATDSCIKLGLIGLVYSLPKSQ